MLALGIALAACALFVHTRLRLRRMRADMDLLRERTDRLKMALWASGERYWEYDPATHTARVLETETAPAAILLQERQIALDTSLHPDDVDIALQRLADYLAGRVRTFECDMRTTGDDPRWIRLRGRAIEVDAAQQVRKVAGTVVDVTRLRREDRDRRIAAEVLRSMSEAVSVVDAGFDFVTVNPAFSRITGFAAEDVIGRNARMLDSRQHDAAFYDHIRRELVRNRRWSGEMWQRRNDGEEFLCAIEAAAVASDDGAPLYVTVLNDITQQKRAEQELRYLASFDTLTDLPNRALLSERLSRAIVRARRERGRIAVLFLDLDRFKDINDSFGHATGDRLLRAVARRLQETVGPHQTVARLSGDEFTIVLENIETAQDAEQVARDIIAAFEAPLLPDRGHEITMSPSIGISLYPEHGQTPTELLKRADTAMYQAKNAGRRTFMRYDEVMDASTRERALLSNALRKVLDRGELRLAFQPRLDLARSRIGGVEALLRWHSDEHGEIAPDDFIPLAEESGLILEIGDWVLREACRVMQRWRQQGISDLRVSVNVSMLQLNRGDFPDVVRHVLEDTGMPASALELELTESVLMADAEQNARHLRALRALGVSLAIDDFGTGYSSLAYLRRLPIQTIKIDKSFVDGVPENAEDAAIAGTVISMGHSLGLKVVAEGVENEAQATFLAEQQCDEVQGFWLSPPLDAQATLALIRHWAATGPTARPAPPLPP